MSGPINSEKERNKEHEEAKSHDLGLANVVLPVCSSLYIPAEGLPRGFRDEVVMEGLAFCN